jgi:hypothetical protein
LAASAGTAQREKDKMKTYTNIDRFTLHWRMKSVLKRYRVTPLKDNLPSLRCRVRYAHTATQTPRKKMANAIILLLPTHRFRQVNGNRESEMKSQTKESIGK